MQESAVGGKLAEAITRSLSRKGRALSLDSCFRWSLLPVIVYGSCGGEGPRSTPAAAAIDLWLAAGDVFDEVEDRDVPGLWQEIGEAQALNAGTALLLLSRLSVNRLLDRGFRESLVLSAAREIDRAGIRSCVGQHLDLLNEDLMDVTEKDYIEMTTLRSGSLIECACRIGAVLAEKDQQTIDAFGRGGRNLGVFAQIVNDVRSLDTIHGKKSDLVRKKKTLPVVYGLEVGSADDRRFLSQVFIGAGPVTDCSQARMKSVLANLGATDYCSLVADLYLEKGLDEFRAAGMAAIIVDELGEVLRR